MTPYEPRMERQLAAERIAVLLAKNQLGQITSAELNQKLTELIPLVEPALTDVDTTMQEQSGSTSTPPQSYTPGGPPPAY